MYSWEANLYYPLPAVLIVPSLGFVLAAKPTVGLAAFSYRPTVRALVGIVAIAVLSFMVQLARVGDWLEAIRTAAPHFSPAAGAQEATAATIPYFAPVSRFGRFLLLLAALKWRRPEARFLIVLEFVPQTMALYACVLLYLIPATLTESTILALLSYAPYFGPAIIGVVDSVTPDSGRRATGLSCSSISPVW